MEKKQLVWLVGGPLSFNGNIRETIQGLSETSKGNLDKSFYGHSNFLFSRSQLIS